MSDKLSEIEKLEKECHELFDIADKIDECFRIKNDEYVKQIQQKTDEITKPLELLRDNINGILHCVNLKINHIKHSDMKSRRDEITKPYYDKYHKLQKKIWALEKKEKKRIEGNRT